MTETQDRLRAFRDRHYDALTFDLALVAIAIVASVLIVLVTL